LQTLFFEVINHFDCTIIEGFRDEADQNKAYASGKSRLKWPYGKHNQSPSMAVDVAPFPVDWDNEQRFLVFAGFVLGTANSLKAQCKMSHYVRWGGAWNGLDKLNTPGMLNDFVHFELM